MNDGLLILLAVLALIIVILLIVLILRNQKIEIPVYETELDGLDKSILRIDNALREELFRLREEASNSARHNREEISCNLAKALATFEESMSNRMMNNSTMQKDQLEVFSKHLSEKLYELTRSNAEKLEQVRVTVDIRLKGLQEENNAKLEKMRETVDEKLHNTLEKRLGESFQQVSQRLNQVHQGLGEMKTLAAGVGDLKKVMTNIKTRGTWGEVQLDNLLEQVLTIDQYSKNVATKKGSSDRVEFAIKLPEKDGQDGIIWIPVDAKFPLEDYQRLIDAQEQADVAQISELGKALENRIKLEAKTIRDKYIDPPNTTDFGILFLPVEGLYAEVLRRPGLVETLQREYRVVLAGPTTILAFLNSLQMGFKTLAIEKRSSEVWTLLGTVKTEFGQFGDILDKTHKKLQEASNNIDTAARKTRTIERKLRGVQDLPIGQATVLLAQSEEGHPPEDVDEEAI